MNEIIKNIEAAQLKASVPEFHVGDTVKVYNKIKEGENHASSHVVLRKVHAKFTAVSHLQYSSKCA